MALTTYTKTAWANGTSPAINATNLGKIEDRLYDLTEEAITPTLLAITTATQEITSLPSTALKSRLDVTLQGNTYVNLVKNGNFADGTTNWLSSGSTLSATNNVLTVTGDGTATYINGYQFYNKPVVANEKIYVSGIARVTNADATSLQLVFRESSLKTAEIITNPTQNSWYKLSNIMTVSNDYNSPYIRVINYYADSATANGKVMEVQNVMTINLTNLFGAGNEPTLEEADLMFANWFDDVESTGKQIVKSVGKNLFNINTSKTANRTGYDISGLVANERIYFNLQTPNTDVFVVYCKVKPNTQYTIKIGEYTIPLSLLRIVEYADFEENSLNYIQIYSGQSQVTITTKNTTNVIGVGFYAATGITIMQYMGKIQIEQGSTATTYEEYTETTAIIPAELKQVSNSIRDTFDANLGVYTKNVESDLDISDTQYASIDTATYTNVDVVKTTAFSNMKPATTSADGTTAVYDKDLKKLSEVAQADIDDLNSVGKYYVHTDETIWFIVENGLYADIASARTGLGTSKIFYQLATPIITNYYSNIINAEPSGTVYVYPFVADYDFYDNGCGVSDTLYPINFLEYVNIVDKDTGALSPVDLSTCTVATGGLSFTSTALSASDLVDFGYTYKELSTIPTIEYSYPTNLKATVDGNTNNIRDLDKKQEQSTTALNLKTDEIARDLKILKLMGGL